MFVPGPADVVVTVVRVDPQTGHVDDEVAPGDIVVDIGEVLEPGLQELGEVEEERGQHWGDEVGGQPRTGAVGSFWKYHNLSFEIINFSWF